MSAEVIHICVCCKADKGTQYEADMADMVCEQCHLDLRGGSAWLKVAGLRECTPVINNRLKGLGFFQ